MLRIFKNEKLNKQINALIDSEVGGKGLQAQLDETKAILDECLRSTKNTLERIKGTYTGENLID